MKDSVIIDIVIPAFNEEKSIPHVLKDIPRHLVRHIVVADNCSTDNTAEQASLHGAIVVRSKKKGYGAACLDGLAYLQDLDTKTEIVVFMDGDYSDYPQELATLVTPIVEQGYDLVIGSRALGNLEKGSMTPVQIFGNWLATNLICLFYKYEFTDLGPFRAITWSALEAIQMSDKDFGWTVEMQIKCAKHKLRCTEVPVSYRRRIGVSKVSGTIKGAFLAGHKILWTIYKHL